MSKIFSYLDVCNLAFKNAWDVDIRPEEHKVIVKQNNQIIGEYVEIGNCIFAFVETNPSSQQLFPK